MKAVTIDASDDGHIIAKTTEHIARKPFYLSEILTMIQCEIELSVMLALCNLQVTHFYIRDTHIDETGGS